MEVVAQRDILKGEEVTVRYTMGDQSIGTGFTAEDEDKVRLVF